MTTLTRLYRIVEDYIVAVVLHTTVRRVVAWCVYGILPVVLLAALVADAPRVVAVKAGSLAQLLLLVLLFMKPIGTVFGIRLFRRTLVYRRMMGVAMMYGALYHAVVLMDVSRIFDAQYYTVSNHVVYGAAALCITVLLGVTSNDFAIRVLRRSWKRLHVLAYPLLVLVLLHAGMAEGEMKKVIVLVPAFIVLKVLEHRRVRITLPIVSRS